MWQKVSTPQVPAWDFKKDKSVAGKFMDKRENIGPNNSNLYILEQADGTQVAVWGSTILDDRLNTLQPGEMVRIDYLGEGKAKAGRKPYHNFEVWHDVPEGATLDAEDQSFIDSLAQEVKK